MVPLPILPPRVAWLRMPRPGRKKAGIPQAVKARGMPQSHHFQYFVNSENRPLAIIQSTIPRNTAVKANPIPKSSSRASQASINQLAIFPQVVAAQFDIWGQNHHINPTIMSASNSLSIGPRYCFFLVLPLLGVLAAFLFLGIA